jgi:hypothetical protein|tara:strand:+ start:305 stop:658 length:354 start_codon:yes stop_codon:yes gene_type:complete
VHVRSTWLGYESGNRLPAIDEREIRGTSDGVRQHPKRGERRVSNNRLQLATHGENTETQPTTPIGSSSDQRVLFQRDDQSINNRASDSHPPGDLGDGQTLGGIRHLLEDPQPSIECL